jgi:tripartite-type tricarboxylate transporter receptor subunit TctC
VLVVRAGQGVRTAQELFEHLRHRPETMNYASAGEGTVPHLAAEILLRRHGLEAEGVTHSGAAPALNAMMRGQAQWMVPSLFSALPYLKTGKLVALAVAGQQRLPAWPQLPTFNELGLQELDLTQWYGLFAPALTASAVVNSLNDALNKVLVDPETVARLSADGVQVQPSSPQQLGLQVKSQLQHWTHVLEGFRVTESVEQ